EGEILEDHFDGDRGNDTIEDNADVNPSTNVSLEVNIPEVANDSSIVSPSTPPGNDLNIAKESCSTWLDYVGPLITDELDSEKRWSYRDPKGNIQGSFSLAQLHMWKDYFPSDLQIWSYYGNVKETILLHNALKRRTKNAVQAEVDMEQFNSFVMYNTFTMILSLAIVLVLISGISLKNKFLMWVLTVATLFTVVFMVATYLQSLAMMAPDMFSERFAQFLRHISCVNTFMINARSFNSLDSSVCQVVGSSEETSNFLLCKATEVVMEKGGWCAGWMAGRGHMGGCYRPMMRNNGNGYGPPLMMHPQSMMSQGFDPSFNGPMNQMGNNDFSGGSTPLFSGMMPSFLPVGNMGLPGLAPHVNPAFFGRASSSRNSCSSRCMGQRTLMYSGLKEIDVLMLMTMEPHLQRNLDTLGAYDMLKELKTMFAEQSEHELLQIEYDSFVQNYNMHGMGKTVNELHAMLKLHEQTLPKKDAPALHAIRAGKVQKKNKNKKPQLAARGNNQGKEKSKLAYAPKPKIPPPPKKEDPAKDSNKKLPQGASTSNIFTIELFTFPGKYWVYDTGCGTHICNTTQGLRGSRKLKPGALSLYMGNGQRAAVEAIRSLIEDRHPSENTSSHHDEDNQEIDVPQSDIIPIRRSTRTRHTPDRMCLNIKAGEYELGDLNEPTNYKAVLLDPESNKWLTSMNVEMQSMKDNKVLDLVNLPPNGKIVSSKWLFKKKTDIDGVIHTYKARLVAKGFTQTPRIDYEETFSLVADIRAIRILISIFVFYDYKIWKIDVKTAFLNGYLSKEDVKSYLGRCFAIKDLGEAAYILGIKIYKDRSKWLIGLCQIAYIEKILKRFFMENSKRRSIAMQEKLKLSKSQVASTPAEVKRMQNVPYALATGYVFILNGGVVDWKSTKQIIFATSSTEAEYIAASDASKEAV
ncbi:retrotransposon protein, putative, ty1-copia subclass, partial [Tanacetum coccineum]